MCFSGNIFVASLSVADMLVAIYPYPLMLHSMAIGGWGLSQFQCQLVGFITGLSVVGSIFNIMAIAINRYCYICHSLQYEWIFSMHNTFIYLLVTWIMSVLAVLPNMYIGTIEYDSHIYTCIFSYLNNPAFAVTIRCIYFILPLLIVGFCYVRIWIKVLTAHDQARQNPDRQLAEVRNFLTMFVIFLLFAMCWCPINVLTVLMTVSPKEMVGKIPHWLYLAVYFIAYFHSCLNAVTYALLNENFQREYWVIIHAMRHPILFFSGLFTDVCETWEAQALARARACDQVQEQAHEQDHANSCPAVEVMPLNVQNVPLPGVAAAGQPECASGHPKLTSGLSRPASAYHKSVSGHYKSVFNHSKIASGYPNSACGNSKSDSSHPNSATVYPKPTSAHFKADSVHFKPNSTYLKPVTRHHSPAGSNSKSAYSRTTNRPEPTGGHIKPATRHPKPTTVDYPKPAITSHLKPVITGYPEPAAAGYSEFTASRHLETIITRHLECDITDLPEFASIPATRPPEPAASPSEPATTTDPHDLTVFTTNTNDYHEGVVIDVEIDSDEMAM